MLKNWKKKLIAMILIFTMTFGNFALVGKTYAASIFDGIFGGDEDTTGTGNKNIEFEAYFIDEQSENSTSIKSDVKNENLMIGVNVKVKDSGYLKDAKVLLGNGEELNFKIDSTDLVENENVQSFENNELAFSQLNAGSEASVVFPVSYESKKYIESSNVSKNNKISFEGTYVNGDAEEISVSKDVDLKLSWSDEREVSSTSEVTKYIGYSVDGVSGLILQTSIKADNVTELSSLPVKNTEVEIDVPIIDEIKPSTINVVAKSTLATTGKENDEIVFNQDNWNYDEESNRLIIKVNNEPELISTQNENDILIDETAPKKEMYTNASGVDEYLITYTYNNVEIAQREITSNVLVSFNMFGNNSLKSENEFKYEVLDEIGDIVTYSAETSTSSISKGYTYLNYNNEENKYEIEIDNKLIFNVSYKDIVEKLYYNDLENLYHSKTGEVFAQNDIYYKSLSISKDTFNTMLGEEGYINILDSDGNLLFVINKDTEVNDEGNYKILFENTVKNIQIETSAPINDGNLIFSVIKAYSNVSYDKEAYKNFDELTINATGNAKYIYMNDLVDCGKSSLNVKLEDTKTTAELEIGQDSLSTLAMNNNVELKIKLNNEDIKSDVYGNSEFNIKVPEYIETIEVTDASIVYGEGLELSSVEAYEMNGDMYLRATTSGVQQSLSSGIISDGTNIVLNTNIKVDLFAPATDGEFELTYTNSEATNYEEEINYGHNSATVNYSAPSGVVSVNSTSDYNDEGSTLTSVNQGKKQDEIAIYSNSKVAKMELTVMNNEKNPVSDVAILGRVPFTGVKDIVTSEEIGTTVDANMVSEIVSDSLNNTDFIIYYSENGEATRDLNDNSNGWTINIESLENVKSFLIVPADENYVMDVASKIRFTYNYQIPENLAHNEEIYGTFATYYTNNTEVATLQEVAVADLIGLVTGEGPEFDVETKVNNKNINEFEELEITSIVKNTGKATANDLVVTIPIPEYTTFKEAKSNNENATYEYDEEEKMVIFNLASIEIGSTVEFTTIVKTDEVYSNNEEDVTIEVYSNVTATDLDTILKTNVEKVSIKQADLQVTMDSALVESDSVLKQETEFSIYVRVKNLKSTEVKNAVVSLNVNDEFEYISAYNLKYGEDGVTVENGNEATYDPATKTVTWNIDKIDSLDIVSLTLTLKVKPLEGNQTLKEVHVTASAKADGTEKYESSGIDYLVGKAVLVIKQSTSTTNTYVKEGETINYQFIVTNEGSVPAQSVVLRDEIPEGLVVKTISYEVDGVAVQKAVSEKDEVRIGTAISPGSTLTVDIGAVATSLNGTQELSVTNGASVIAKNVNKEESNTITHIIESSGNVVTSKGESSTGLASSSTDETTSSINKTYKITGTAWLDSNNDGMRNEDEQLMKGIKATLVDSDAGAIKQTTVTNSKGEYTFTGVNNGNYIIIFDYDTVLYTVTIYQKENVTSNVNSDVITTKIEQDGVLRNGAVTDVVTVADGSVSNIDIGLVDAMKFDLSLNMGISKITVQNSSGTNTINYDNAKLTKTEIGAKQMNGSVVYIEYTFTVKNEGEIAGFAKKVVDYIPEGMSFNSSMNSSWYTGTDGNLYTSELANTEIKPGETKTFKLVLSKTMTNDNTGAVSNTAEIAEDYNIYGVSDLDSTPMNKAQNEDDFARADSYLSVKTGEVFIYISVIITTIILVGIAVSIIVLKVRYKLEKGGV